MKEGQEMTEMKAGPVYSLAPLEGTTGFIFRNAFAAFFPSVKRYYTPFMAPGPEKLLTKRQLEDVRPENNRGICLVPQVMTCRADVFRAAADILMDMGYDEIDLNLGCPSGTVTAKGKGSGFLRSPDELKEFLDDVTRIPGLKVSVKTRIGYADQAEWEELLRIYKSVPLSELIIHPRLRTEFYRGAVHTDCFSAAYEERCWPLVYNGDVFSEADASRVLGAFPGISGIMIGRGFLMDPCLADRLPGTEGKGLPRSEKAEREKLRLFHERLFSDLSDHYGDPGPVLAKCKEVWDYLRLRFPDREREIKKVKKAKSLSEYRARAEAVFAESAEA